MSEASFADQQPDLAKWWSSDRNPSGPEHFSPSSGRKVWWECPVGHIWQKSIAERVRYPQCPGCRVRRLSGVTPGVDDLATLLPEIAELWDPKRNEPLLVSDVKPSSKNKVFWMGEEEKRRICDVVFEKGEGARRRDGGVMQELDPSTAVSATHPELLSWFSPQSPVSPDQATSGARNTALFVCPEGHEWNESIGIFVRRRADRKCPVCSNRQLFVGLNDLATTHPEIAAMLKDASLGTKLKRNSWDVVDWVCIKGHTYSATVTNVCNYGAGCPICLNRTLAPGINDLATTHPQLAAIWSENSPLSPNEVFGGSEKVVHVLCQECSKVIKSPAYILIRRDRWTCSSCQTSSGELELGDFIESLGVEVIRNTRKLIGRLEVDVWVPSKNIGFEFNGIYWHSDRVIDKDSHRKKWDAAEKAGIQLVSIWEDDWRDRRSVVESMIRHKLGVSSAPRIGARQCTVAEVPVAEAKAFLEANHIQGFVSGSIYSGLWHRDELVAIMVCGLRNDSLYIDRFATSAVVRGGFSKLLRHVVKSSGFSGQVVSFADRMVSDGSVYESCGFTVDSVLDPDYSYLFDNARQHKFNFRKKRFASDERLEFREDLTERELAELNRIPRVWDAGKLRMVKTV